MRIAFDVTSCAKPRRGGIATYGWELAAACARLAPEHDYRLALRPNRWLARRHLRSLRDAMKLRGGPRLLVDPLADLCLGPLDVLHSIGVRLPAGGRFAKIVTLHDLNVFEYPELSDADWRQSRQARIRQTLERADLVIVYSRAGVEALQRHLAFPAERVRVVPIGVDTVRFLPLPEAARRAVLDRHGLRGRPYVLHVGAFSARKNQRGLLAAFARAELPPEWRLVLGGPTDDDAATLRQQARALGLADERVLLPGWVTEADYPALLSGAGTYVCASLHEGFGLPVIEAQACGAPVLSSDRGALRETVGDCGVLFDPADEAAFARALRELAGDAGLRARLAAAGPARVARDFTWEQVARKTLAAYGEAARR